MEAKTTSDEIIATRASIYILMLFADMMMMNVHCPN